MIQQTDQNKSFIKDSIDSIDTKWSSLNTFMNSYKVLLGKLVEFRKLFDEIDFLAAQKIQRIRQFEDKLGLFIESTKNDSNEINLILRQIEDAIDEFNRLNKDKIKNLTELALEIYGNICLVFFKKKSLFLKIFSN